MRRHDDHNHGHQPEFLRREQSGEHHDVCQIQEGLRTVRRRCGHPAGDRALPEIRQKMIGCKVLCLWARACAASTADSIFTGGSVTTEATIATSTSLV